MYLRYIVDHYDNFPDIAIFVQGRPHDHLPFPENLDSLASLVGCIRPDASFFNFNYYHNPHYYLCRTTEFWDRHGPGVEVWTEQCHRNILKLLFNESYVKKAYPQRLPMRICLNCCNQFLVSKHMIHSRPFKVWKTLYEMIGVNNSCHWGEPEYDTLFAYHKNSTKVGPEPASVKGLSTGYWTQGTAAEYLSHVIFGFKKVIMGRNTLRMACNNFYANCSKYSPCNPPYHEWIKPTYFPALRPS